MGTTLKPKEKKKVEGLPEGFEVESIPEGFVLDSGGSGAQLAAQQQGEAGPIQRFFRGAIAEPIEGFVSAIGESIKTGKKGPGILDIDPFGVASSLAGTFVGEPIKAQARQIQRASESLGQGRVFQGVKEGALGLVPLFGPAVQRIEDRMASGDIAGALGEATTLIGAAFLKGRGPKTKAPQLEKIPSQVMKALKPPKQKRLGLESSLPTAVDELVSGGYIPKSLDELHRATGNLRKQAGKEIEGILKTNNASISGSELANQIRSSIDKFSEITNPTSSKRAKSIASAIEKEFPSLTLEQAEGLRQRLNQELGFFFRKNPAQQREALANAELAGKLVLRETLESIIEQKLTHSSLKDVRKRYSALRQLEDATLNKMIDQMVKDDPSLLALDSLDTITAGSAVAALLSGQPHLAAGLGKTVLARRLITVWEKIQRSPDVRIRRAFESARGVGLTKQNKGRAIGLLIPMLLGEDEGKIDLKPTQPTSLPSGTLFR